MAELLKTVKGNQYFKLEQCLIYFNRNEMHKEVLKVSGMDLYENEDGKDLFVNKKSVGEILSLPEFREMETETTTFIF